MPAPNVSPMGPADLLEHAGHELNWALRAAEEWKRQQVLHICVGGYDVQVYAMDSTFLHARALFEFLTVPPSRTRPSWHSVTELDPAGQLPVLESPLYDTEWSDGLHDRLAHLQDRNSNPNVMALDGTTKHLKELAPDVADELRRLWTELIQDLTGAGLTALATRAQELLDAAEQAATNVRVGDRRDLY